VHVDVCVRKDVADATMSLLLEKAPVAPALQPNGSGKLEAAWPFGELPRAVAVGAGRARSQVSLRVSAHPAQRGRASFDGRL